MSSDTTSEEVSRIDLQLHQYLPSDTVSVGERPKSSNFTLEENRGRNRYNVEMFLCAYYISAGQTSLLQVQ